MRGQPHAHTHTQTHITHAPGVGRGHSGSFFSLVVELHTRIMHKPTHILTPSGANMCQRTQACRSKQKPETLTALKPPKNKNKKLLKDVRCSWQCVLHIPHYRLQALGERHNNMKWKYKIHESIPSSGRVLKKRLDALSPSRFLPTEILLANAR